MISEKRISKFVNSERSEMLCLENGEVQDVNETLISSMNNFNMQTWIKRNIHDFNIRMMYDDNDQM